MRNLLILITIMLVGGCVTTPTVESVATTPTMKSVAGTYERNDEADEATYRGVLLENGIVEAYENGKKEEGERKWTITKEGEIHVTEPDGSIGVLRMNKDGSITSIAEILTNEDIKADLQDGNGWLS